MLPNPENKPPAPSFRATFANVNTSPLVVPPPAPAYSIRVFTTVIGFKSTAATILAEHPAPKVIADCSNELAFSLLKLDASSFVTRSSRKKYKPAPAVVLTIADRNGRIGPHVTLAAGGAGSAADADASSLVVVNTT